MARTTTITDEQILKAARSVFLEEGFGAQTAKIAKRAQVSEGSIFKRFPTKEALFFAALEIDRSPAWHAEIDRRVGTGDCKDNLQSIFHSILLWFTEMLPRTIATMGNLGAMSSQTFDGIEHPLITDERKLSVFLQQEMELRRLRNCDANLLTCLILGSLTSYVFRAILTGQHLTQERVSEIATGTLELIWSGIAPE